MQKETTGIMHLLTKGLTKNKKVNMTNISGKEVPFEVQDIGSSLLISNKELKTLIPNPENRLGINKDITTPEKRAQNRQRRLVKSMKKHGFLKEYPILIFDDPESTELMICNGHNRWQVACDLGLDGWVQFTEISDIAVHAKAQNAATPWNINDFVDCKANKGYKEAKILRYVSNKYGLSISLSIQLLTKKKLSGASAENMINEQNIVIKDFPWAEKIAQQVHELCGIITHIKGQKLQQSLVKCMEAPMQNGLVYEHERMKTKLEYQYGKMVPVTTIRDYLRQLQDIYNHKTKFEDRFYFPIQHK